MGEMSGEGKWINSTTGEICHGEWKQNKLEGRYQYRILSMIRISDKYSSQERECVYLPMGICMKGHSSNTSPMEKVDTT